MRDFSGNPLLSFMLKSFQLSGLLRRPITAMLMPNGELKALKPHQVESFTAVQSSQPVSLSMACITIRSYTFQLRC